MKIFNILKTLMLAMLMAILGWVINDIAFLSILAGAGGAIFMIIFFFEIAEFISSRRDKRKSSRYFSDWD